VPGSVAGDRDVRLLMSYAERGLVVTGMRMRLLSMYAISDRSHRLVLRVRDRLVRATARSRFEPSVHLRLPTDHPSTHEVTLVRRPRRAWQVSQVR
jgi:hypothetical protein